MHITIIFDKGEDNEKTGTLELTDEAIEHFRQLGIPAIEQSIEECIRRMLETYYND